MGATCCYCGQCGKAGLLPALQPAATEWTQYPDSRSHGPEAFRPPPAGPASLPALLSVQLSIIHLSGCGSKLHPVQCSKDATHTTHSFCEWVRTVPLSLWQEAQNQVNNTTLPSPYAERYRIVSAFFSTAVKVNNPVAAEQQYNIQTQT